MRGRKRKPTHLSRKGRIVVAGLSTAAAAAFVLGVVTVPFWTAAGSQVAATTGVE